MSHIKPIRCLAIVNRGEAAMRCIRAVKSLRALEGQELRVAALYTAVDRAAPFVRHADVAIQLPVKTTPVAAYLDHDVLVEALARVGADAVWPGWGFVAESPEFVDRLAREGIRFLGPSAATMRALGDKIASKELAERVDVPVTAWSGGQVQDADDGLAHARRIGFPVVIKASAGGGGRGIRVVREPSTFAELFRSAQSEAKSAFGDDRMFVEAMVRGGRHIEVQIIADQHGTVVALGCRDCSVQRRHQKVIEEAPPAGLPPLMFRALKESAVQLAEAVGYCGAGTVEFLVKGADFFFLEMNPRLQVEHGITEEITGTDLVQLQIRVARGEPLPSEFRERGFAIEARVCAEDPDAGFLPAPGRIARFDPALGPRLRIDTGVASDSTVPAAFDSLIAKVIASGDTREEARARLVTALRDFDLVIEGGATNKGYLLELLEAEDFRLGSVDTSWLDQWNERRSQTTEHAAEAFMLAAILSYREARNALRSNFFLDAGSITQDKISPSEGLEFDLSYRGKQYRTRVFASGASRYRVHFDGRVVAVHVADSSTNAARLRFEGRDLRVLYDVSEVHIRVEVEGNVHRFGRQTAGQVRAVAPSMVVTIHVEVGSRVESGQPLGVLEAMKMEIGFDAPVSGVVTEIRVRKGQQVAAGDVILVIDSKSDDANAVAPENLLQLPLVYDPLSLFFDDVGGVLAEPNLPAAAAASREQRQRAGVVVAEEIRRIVLGYDASAPRVNMLIRFLEAPLPADLPVEFLKELLEVKAHLSVFVDIERLFTRSIRKRSGTGNLEPFSNDALMRLYMRRMRAAGSGLPEPFLQNLKAALAHYDDTAGLDYCDALERAVLRLFASQVNPELRCRLIGAMVHRITALSEHLDLGSDAKLKQDLSNVAALRGHLPNPLADSVTEAVYRIYQRPQLYEFAERTTRQLERWLSDDAASLAAPDFASLAQVPPGRFRQVLKWLSDDDPKRQSTALAAAVRRLYAPRASTDSTRLGPTLERVAFQNESVVAALLASDALGPELESLWSTLPDGNQLVELFVVQKLEGEAASIVQRVEAALTLPLAPPRLTLTVVDASQNQTHTTFDRVGNKPVRVELHGLHPETARRIEFHRYQSFDLERIDAEDDVYCFFGRAKPVPDDARIFVLTDVRGRPPELGHSASHFAPIFERAFHEAARTLRVVIGLRDPRRLLQWNRIMLFVAHPLELELATAESLAQKLYPVTRHLGLERVGVRLKVLEGGVTKDVEVVVSDTTGSHMDVQWREPHRAPLVPVAPYQRSVVAARRRGLVYPYEIVRMLTPDTGEASTGNGHHGQALPPGTFEEYDLDETFPSPQAISVAGRPPGQNQSAIVFGIISTPTAKVPEGMRRVLVLSDPTRGMGALSAGECARVVAALDLAERERLPVEWLPVSSGARIAMDSGTENLDATARVVRRIVTFTQAGGVIHVIVTGVNVGAQSYWDALATMLNHTRGALIMTPRGSMVLTGRAALAASGSVSAEDEVAIGGYERVMGPNGQAQYYAEDLADAYRILYQHYSFTYVVPGESRPRRLATSDAAQRNVCEAPYQASAADFGKIGELFDAETNPGRKRPFAMRALMGAMVDSDGGQLERWQAQIGGETAIVWDAHLGGYPVCMIGIESQNLPRWGYRPLDGPADWNGGTLFPVSSKKVARALNAATGNRPVVIVANLSGFDGSPESMRKLQLEYGAEIARAVVNFEGPLLFLVVSRYHGGAYVVFSRELNPSLRALAVEGSYASVIGGGPAAAVVFPREVQTRVSKDPRVVQMSKALGPRATADERGVAERLLEEVKLEKQAEVAAEFDKIHSVERALEVGSLERIIPARRMREHLIGLLDAVSKD